MRAPPTEYSARDADAHSPEREADAIARFLEKTERLQSIVVAALVIWVGLLALNGDVRLEAPAPSQQRDTQIFGNGGGQPGLNLTTLSGSVITPS